MKKSWRDHLIEFEVDGTKLYADRPMARYWYIDPYYLRRQFTPQIRLIPLTLSSVGRALVFNLFSMTWHRIIRALWRANFLTTPDGMIPSIRKDWSWRPLFIWLWRRRKARRRRR